MDAPLDEARGLARRQPMDLMLLDLELPDGSGLDLLHDIDLAAHGHLAIVTGNPSIETATRAVSAPIFDYLIKPLDPDRLISVLRNSSALSMRNEGDASGGLPDVIAQSDAMRAPINLARRVAPSDATIFLEGETGTGKEIFAQAIHRLSGRSGRFVAINCGAMPHEFWQASCSATSAAASTGAVKRHIGVFEQPRTARGYWTRSPRCRGPAGVPVAGPGNRTVRRVGAADETATAVRVLAATNQDPMDAIAKGQLAQDLYYRLADFTISLPPLRHRGNDVALLARHFVAQFNARYGLRKYLCPSSVRSLQSCAWPGNVRELRSAVQRAYLLTAGDQITVVPGRSHAIAPVETDDTVTFSIGTTWAEMERRTLLKVLAYCANDKTAAAKCWA